MGNKQYLEFFIFEIMLFFIIYHYIFVHTEKNIFKMFDVQKIYDVFNLKNRMFLNEPKKPNSNNIENYIDKYKPYNSNGYISKGEYLCKNILEQIYKGYKFERVRILKNPITGKLIELDCYNEKLKLALEYNGQQHYMYTEKFHKNKEDFYNLQYRDFIKKKLCKEKGIKLIIVPFHIKFENLKTFIENELSRIK